MQNEKLDQILLYGRLGQNPDLRYTKKQEPVCIFSIAENNNLKNEPVWHRIVVWGKQAELCSVMLKKGSPVFVQGQNITRTYQDRQGIQKVIEEIQAQQIGFSNI